MEQIKFPQKWTKPLNDEFHTYVKGHEDWKISESFYAHS